MENKNEKLDVEKQIKELIDAGVLVEIIPGQYSTYDIEQYSEFWWLNHRHPRYEPDWDW